MCDFSVTFRFCSFLANFSRIWFCISSRLVLPIILDSIIATAEKIKSGNPHTRFIAVSERYDVSYAVDPAYSRIDQIYILRKSMRKNGWADIDKDVVWKLFKETTHHLERPWSDIEARIRKEGVVI